MSAYYNRRKFKTAVPYYKRKKCMGKSFVNYVPGNSAEKEAIKGKDKKAPYSRKNASCKSSKSNCDIVIYIKPKHICIGICASGHKKMSAFGIIHFFEISCLDFRYYFIHKIGKADTERYCKKSNAIENKMAGSNAFPCCSY